jgi:tetratricopeptide (TPR) repeat protein
MRRTPRALVTFVGACLALWASVAIAQGTLWETYLDAAKTAAQQGRHADAEKMFSVALKEAEQFGAQDVRVATTLSALADLYRGQNKWPEAEPLYRRALTIQEKALPADHLAIRSKITH